MNDDLFLGAQLGKILNIKKFFSVGGSTIRQSINPLTSPGEVVYVFTSPYLSEGAPALGKQKG